MSSTVAVQHQNHHTTHLLCREPEIRNPKVRAPSVLVRTPSNSNNQSMSISKSTLPRASANNGAPRPRSPTEDERAALQIQQLSAGASFEKQSSPTHSHSPNSRSGNSDAGAQQVPTIKRERAATPDPSTGKRSNSLRQHRPRRLDLSNNMSAAQATATAHPSAPLTAKDTGNLSAMHEVGLACLSPGFQTQDPSKQEQLQRSMEIREQQRRTIETRYHKPTGKDTEKKNTGQSPPSASFSKPLGTSRRKGPPPALSLTGPSAHQFASEPRVVHSAPINQSFTGLKPAPAHVHPLSRQVLEHSHHHHYHAAPTSDAPSAPPPQFGPISNSPHSNHSANNNNNTRLPPIQDVFNNANDGATAFRPSESLSRENSGRTLYAPYNTHNPQQRSPLSAQHPATLLSPGHPPQQASSGQQNLHHRPGHSREREFHSAEEAVHTLSGGREDLLPKIVHYHPHHPHQPPTPPSPNSNHPPNPSQQQGRNISGSSQHMQQRPQYGTLNSLTAAGAAARQDSGRRRTREEYERDYGDVERMDVDGEQRGGARVKSGEWRDDGAWAEERRMREMEEEQRRRGRTRDSGLGLGVGIGMGSREKKEEFLSLCARAWDLLHE